MDAESIDAPKFNVDTFMVRGANVPRIDVVGRDDEGDEWATIGTIDMVKYVAPNYLVSTVSEEVDSIVHIDFAQFDVGRFSEFTHYASLGSRAGMVEDNSDDTLWVQRAGPFDGPDDLEIFCSNGSLMLDSHVRYKYIGIRINPYDTHEGHFKLHSFGFGRAVDMPVEYNFDIGSGPSYEGETSVDFVFDSQPYSSKAARLVKEFDLSYSLADEKLAKMYEHTIKALSLNRRPVWVIESYRAYPEKVYICMFNDEPDMSVIFDEDGERWQELSASLRSSE